VPNDSLSVVMMVVMVVVVASGRPLRLRRD